MRRPAWLPALALLLALAPAGVRAEAEGALDVLDSQGVLRLFRFETEPWPLEAGEALPDNSRVELEAGAKLRLRFGSLVDFCLLGPARLTVYAVPSPAAGEEEEADRVVFKLDEGSLLVDGRFQFGRPADLVLSLPDRSLPLPRDSRFFVRARGGRSAFYLPQPGARPQAQPAQVAPQGLSPLAGARPTGPGAELPAGLFEELERPVKLLVLARDFDQQRGAWPRAAVLGPLLAERLSRLPGLQLVDGSGEAQLARSANSALMKGQDFYLKEVGRSHGARWVLAGNCVSDLAPEEAGSRGRSLRAQAELRLLEAGENAAGLELVSESTLTRVALAGRDPELVARLAMQAAAAELSGYLEWHLGNLLQGRSHSPGLLRLQVENVGPEALQALKERLASLDSVQRSFRRRWSKGSVAFDLLLRKTPQDFDRQWAQAPGRGWRWVGLPAEAPDQRRLRAERAP